VSNHFDHFLGESGLAHFPQLLHVSGFRREAEEKGGLCFFEEGEGGLDALYVSQPTVSKH